MLSSTRPYRVYIRNITTKRYRRCHYLTATVIPLRGTMRENDGEERPAPGQYLITVIVLLLSGMPGRGIAIAVVPVGFYPEWLWLDGEHWLVGDTTVFLVHGRRAVFARRQDTRVHGIYIFTCVTRTRRVAYVRVARVPLRLPSYWSPIGTALRGGVTAGGRATVSGTRSR